MFLKWLIGLYFFALTQASDNTTETSRGRAGVDNGGNVTAKVRRQEEIPWLSGGCVKQNQITFDHTEHLEEIEENNPASCIKLCGRQKFKYAGVKDKDCACGNEQPESETNPDKCGQYCPNGRSLETCGGEGRDGVWNVFSTRDLLGTCVDMSRIENWSNERIEARTIYEQRGACLHHCRTQGFSLAALKGLRHTKSVCYCGDHHAPPCASIEEETCYADCLDDEHVCLIKTRQEGCVNVQTLLKYTDQGNTLGMEYEDSCRKFCNTKDSRLGRVIGRLCICDTMVTCEIIESAGATEVETSPTSAGIESTDTPEPVETSTTTVVALSIGAVALVLLILAVGAVMFIRKRKNSNRNKEKEEENTDFNPVYATYEVHDDPVAEARDQNLNYGAVYEGEEMSKSTDVNDDYDTLYN